MKQNFFSLIAVAAFVGALAFNSVANSNKTTADAVTLSNIEALTMGEDAYPSTWCLQVGNGCSDPMHGPHAYYPFSKH